MSNLYQPLHHKYRPTCFDDLVGQQSIVSTLKQAILTNSSFSVRLRLVCSRKASVRLSVIIWFNDAGVLVALLVIYSTETVLASLGIDAPL